MSAQLTIRPLAAPHVVRAGGAILGETTQALEVTQPGADPVVYFPRSDIAMAFLDRSETQKDCTHTGTATFYSIVTKSKVIADAAWSYETPSDAAGALAGHLAFATRDDITVEQL